ncbi:glycerophosphoryl diester phosphodiesterase membrane domain-containing protein [Agromyces sp. NPDC060279]|uniref:glycerophosphoryl diester phosphodiesterase membrane domain-containing protein n=1 Tax=Agromyces sp. NPDC060279 TaxID=3347092 RepID=UPI0036698E07
MTDPQWQAPESGAWPPPANGGAPGGWPAPAPQQGYGQPGYGQPAYGAPQPQYGAPQPQYGAPHAGWTPPPKPGLLPLRPLGFGTLMWAPFRTLRRNPGPVLGSGLIVQLVIALATVGAFVPFFFAVTARAGSASVADQSAIAAGAVGGFLLLMLIPLALSVVGSAFLQGIMVVEVASGTLGERLRFGELWRRTARRIWPLIGWTLLVAVAVVLAILVVVVLGVLIGFGFAAATDGGVGGIVATVLIIGFVALGVGAVGVWLAVKLSLVPSVIVLEQAGVGRAIARSWQLTNGVFWRTFGVEALVAVILYFAAQLVSTPVSVIGGIVVGLVDPTGSGSGVGAIIALYAVSTVLSLVLGAVTAVVQSAVVAVVYVDLRMRKEGLDLVLQRHVELREAGVPVGDPFAPSAAPTATAPNWA